MKREQSKSGRKQKIKILLKMMNKQNKRLLPVTPPLVALMDMSVTDHELDYLLSMGGEWFVYDQALLASGMDEEAFGIFFKRLIRKGLLHADYDENESKKYRLNAIVVGWYEQMVHYLKGKPEEKRFSEIFNDYFKRFRRYNVFPLRTVQNLVLQNVIASNQDIALMRSVVRGGVKTKRIPIHKTVVNKGSHVFPTYTVNALMEDFGNKDAIYLLDCVCRHANELLASGCGFGTMKDVCFVFHNTGKHLAEIGYARKVAKSEALEILAAVRDQGAIHTVIHERDDPELPVVSICNCCWDCCGILRNYNTGAVALKYNVAFMARITPDAACKGCGKCEKYCPTAAMSVREGQATIKNERCIGCGQCAYQCPQNNIELYADERSVFLPILKRSEARIEV